MNVTSHTPAQIARLAILIKHISVAMLTNVDVDGLMKSRPMSLLEMDKSGCLWFFTRLNSAKIGHMDVVNVSFSDAARATYVSLSGRCEVNTDITRIKKLWTPLAKPWFPDGPESTNLALLAFSPNSAEYWSAPHCKLVHLLARTDVVGAPNSNTAKPLTSVR